MRSTAPITVMPSRPATSREALSSAEAMPARAAGVDCMTALVSGTFISPAPGAEQHEPGQQAGVARVQAEAGEQDQADDHEQHPERHRAVRPGPRLDPRREPGEQRDAQRHRHERQAGLGRRETERVSAGRAR